MELPDQFRDPQLETSGEVIGFYPREFYPLDNFSSFQVEIDGQKWTTAEHAYQAMKFIKDSPEIAELIAEATSAHDAQKIAVEHKNQVTENWSEDKTEIMELICRLKLQQHPYVAKKLLETGNIVIVEDSPKDAFWGWGADREGDNELGKVWMKLREELRQKSTQ